MISAMKTCLIPTAELSDPCPFSICDCTYSLWVVCKEVPSLCTFVEYFVIGVEDCDCAFIGSQISPDVFHGVQFW